MVAVDAVAMLLFAGVILVNRRGHVTASRVTFVAAVNLLAFTNAVGLGREARADLLLLGLMAVPFALFDLSEWVPLVSGVVLTLFALAACALAYRRRAEPLPAAGSLRIFKAYSLVLAVAIILFTLFQSSRENARVERALRLDIAARERAERELAESRQAAINAAKMAASAR